MCPRAAMIREFEHKTQHRTRLAHFDLIRRTFSYVLRKTSKPKKPKKMRQRNYALVVRRLIDERGRHVQDIIDIKSPRLCDVLQEINEGVENIDLSRSEPEVSDSPNIPNLS